MVELSGDPVAVAEVKAAREFSATERGNVKKKLRKAQDAISDDISANGGKVVAKLQSAYNGIQVRINAGKVDELAKLPGVVGVHTLTPKALDNTVSVPFLGVPQVWQDTGYTGKGVKVAIIDTGIDYTHADFGGPGTVAAWDAAHAASASTPDPTLFGPNAPRVKGGYDFVGDDYDATGDNGSVTPVPDDNPLDCEGHGSHVAGTAGGSGVNADGTTYTGPYNADTENNAFKVGPGVAPQVDLYALKVFGCQGSTDVVVQALDWAVDHGMDVVNMSLGSDYGSADDPDAVAASNAVAAGVVVVASSGNAGHNPYLTGSPGSGHGVLSVAAVDSAANFPGAKLTIGATSIPAINANGADPLSGSYTVVVVADDPATTENEALGCSTNAYTKAGVTSGAHQIAVVSRGTCARVAKAIFGQQAGAAAVVMVNTTADYPPYEGTILSNPDDGTPYTVTIPFLGVRSTDGPALVAADGQTLTLSAAALDNPAFRGYASFTSGGPANPDSSLSPNISAPGVSIRSVSIGTGSDSEVESGTSMAAPHVAGVAALAVQAHPNWRAQDVAATLGSTADPDKVAAYSPVLGGGLVDAAQAVKTTSFVTGDSYRTDSGRLSTPTLSFGFDEPMVASVGVKTLTITNKGNRAVTYKLSSAAADGSLPATLRFSSRTVRVQPHSSARVAVSLVLRASTIGSSIGGDDQFTFKQASGNVVLTSDQGVLRVPYLLVPRAQANVMGSASRTNAPSTSVDASTDKDRGQYPTGPLAVKLSNPFGALDADADFYTWGLSDGRDKTRDANGSGYDLRAAGVQSFDNDGDKLVVFAVNNYDKWTNAATNEFDVLVDTNADGSPDVAVFSADSGVVRSGNADGTAEVFVYDLATGDLSASGYLAQAPTDSSTILLPVDASALGLTEASGAFSYTVESSSVVYDGEEDAFSGWAAYNPWAKAIEDGDYVTVARNKSVKVSVVVNNANLATQKPQGLMVVVYDNKSGGKEALLFGVR
ncbi:MAG: S8 family serine peptidase [Actinobacteria bacterium]|nr:S8 family serine peptidase [Actinomycetota bacterium]